MNEWQVGSKHHGYKAKDVCWICGEQIKFFPNEEYGMSKAIEEMRLLEQPRLQIRILGRYDDRR